MAEKQRVGKQTSEEEQRTRYRLEGRYDEEYFKKIQSLYSRVLDHSGINVADATKANMYYFNRTHQVQNVERNIVGQRYIFITRPALHFPSPINIKNVSLFNWLSKSKTGREIMLMLMRPGERVIGNVPLFKHDDNDKITIPPIEPLNSAFIPILSNMATESGGGRDLVMETYETEGDYSGNKLTYAAGADGTYGPGEFSITYRDSDQKIVFLLHLLWFTYIHYVTKGVIKPSWINIVDKIIDYTSSIYVFVLKRDGTTIDNWAKYTGCFPKSFPFSHIQFKSTDIAEPIDEFTMNYTYNRYEPMNPASLYDFNMISKEFAFEHDKNCKPYSTIEPGKMYGDQRTMTRKATDFVGITDTPKNLDDPKDIHSAIGTKSTYDLPERLIDDPLRKKDGSFVANYYDNEELDDDLSWDRFYDPFDTENKWRNKDHSNIFKKHPYVLNGKLIFI